jgi:large subunit ribosomal protein L17
MRHRIGSRKLNRTTSHRLAMLGNMVASLIEHEAIRTTLPKAKEARRMAERIITLGKRGGLANVRLAARTLPNKKLLTKVFDDLSDRYAERAGGYTRIVHLGHRWGDAAPMALLELIDRPQEEKEKDKDQEKKAATKPKGKAKAKEAEGGKAQPKG